MEKMPLSYLLRIRRRERSVVRYAIQKLECLRRRTNAEFREITLGPKVTDYTKVRTRYAKRRNNGDEGSRRISTDWENIEWLTNNEEIIKRRRLEENYPG